MSVNELLILVSAYDYCIVIIYGILFLAALIVSRMIKLNRMDNVASHILSVIVYLVSIPGMFALTLVFYTLFITHQNILDVNAVIYFLPIIAMGLVLYLIGRKTDLNRLPGFGRLSGLMLMLALVCIIVLILYRLRFLVGFFASIQSLVIIGIIMFFLFKWAAAKISGKRDGFD